MRRRGFSLIELAVVIAILGILLALVVGGLARHRRNTVLNQAVDRLVAELQQAQAGARAFGLRQERNDAVPATLTPATAQPNSDGVLVGRVVEKRKGQTVRTVKQWTIGDAGGSGTRLLMTSNNLPLAPLTGGLDQGLAVELLFGGQQLASVLLEPDGRVRNLDQNVSSYIYLGNSDQNYVLEISPLGKVVKSRAN